MVGLDQNCAGFLTWMLFAGDCHHFRPFYGHTPRKFPTFSVATFRFIAHQALLLYTISLKKSIGFFKKIPIYLQNLHFIYICFTNPKLQNSTLKSRMQQSSTTGKPPPSSAHDVHLFSSYILYIRNAHCKSRIRTQQRRKPQQLIRIILPQNRVLRTHRRLKEIVWFSSYFVILCLFLLFIHFFC